MLKLSVQALSLWMSESGVDQVLVRMVTKYLLAQDSRLMVDCLESNNTLYRVLAETTHKLRWDCFLEGRIASVWLEVVKPQLLARN